MDMKRRDFLKIAGLSTLAGVAAPSAVNMLLKGETPQPAHASRGAAKTEEKSGTRLGLVIDHRKFTADKTLAQKCIQACHYTHNVPDFRNKKDEIKWIWETPFENAFPEKSHNYKNEELEGQKFPVLCNHCDNPPCVRACPTQATFKSANGIVAMDYHRCIGCRFCMAACPFGARSFNWRDPRGKDPNGRPFIAKINPKFPTRTRGVVEKCNLCVERVSIGKLPACVEAAGSSKAIIFGDLNDPHSEIRKVLKETFTIQRKPSAGTSPSVFYIV